MGINWKQKLTSRKFWAALTGFATAVLIACNVDKLTVEQVAAILSALAVLAAYIFAEGGVDKARAAAGDGAEASGQDGRT